MNNTKLFITVYLKCLLKHLKKRMCFLISHSIQNLQLNIPYCQFNGVSQFASSSMNSVLATLKCPQFVGRSSSADLLNSLSSLELQSRTDWQVYVHTANIWFTWLRLC